VDVFVIYILKRKLLSGESDYSFFVDVDSEGQHGGNHNVNAQVELVPSDEQGVVYVSLDYASAVVDEVRNVVEKEYFATPA